MYILLHVKWIISYLECAKLYLWTFKCFFTCGWGKGTIFFSFFNLYDEQSVPGVSNYSAIHWQVERYWFCISCVHFPSSSLPFNVHDSLSVGNLSSRDWDILFRLCFLSFCSVPLKVSSYSRVARPPKPIWQIHPTCSAGTSNWRSKEQKNLASKLFYWIVEPWSILAGSWDKKCKNQNNWQSKVI